MKKKKKVDWVSVLLVFVMAAGFCILAYPTIADYWNSFHSSKVIASYMESVEEMDPEEYEKMLSEAQNYNARLASSYTNLPSLSDAEMEAYHSILDLTGTGVMGMIEIPRIRVQLPLYHTVNDSVLQTAAGHLPGSSLPVGGDGSRIVVSGHRGLTSALLFTHLDKLKVGDVFLFRVLKDTYTYEVDEILVVEPDDLSSLVFEPGQDKATLVTCTPYGINTHRLLVTGHRIENLPEGAIDAVSDAVLVTPVQMALYLAAALILCFGIWMWLSGRKKKEREKEKKLGKGHCE